MLADRATWYSGYRLMWMIVMFDLPVKEPGQRKAATQFRHYLMDQGFHMAQFSIYFRLLNGYDAAKAMETRIEAHLPDDGRVTTLIITDKQYERMRTFKGADYEEPEKQEQFQLF